MAATNHLSPAVGIPSAIPEVGEIEARHHLHGGRFIPRVSGRSDQPAFRPAILPLERTRTQAVYRRRINFDFRGEADRILTGAL
jgi:hypothetical protein